ncbi:hypothetical protein C8J57DRAFT_1466004 [Mycena rebaudengoi]|nr:hypothetical protein C8J57DRAFT_1466004 [Mycena rebaudengoi]
MSGRGSTGRPTPPRKHTKPPRSSRGAAQCPPQVLLVEAVQILRSCGRSRGAVGAEVGEVVRVDPAAGVVLLVEAPAVVVVGEGGVVVVAQARAAVDVEVASPDVASVAVAAEAELKERWHESPEEADRVTCTQHSNPHRHAPHRQAHQGLRPRGPQEGAERARHRIGGARGTCWCCDARCWYCAAARRKVVRHSRRRSVCGEQQALEWRLGESDVLCGAPSKAERCAHRDVLPLCDGRCTLRRQDVLPLRGRPKRPGLQRDVRALRACTKRHTRFVPGVGAAPAPYPFPAGTPNYAAGSGTYPLPPVPVRYAPGPYYSRKPPDTSQNAGTAAYPSRPALRRVSANVRSFDVIKQEKLHERGGIVRRGGWYGDSSSIGCMSNYVHRCGRHMNGERGGARRRDIRNDAPRGVEGAVLPGGTLRRVVVRAPSPRESQEREIVARLA